jgi:hypothetical protein
MAGSRNGSSFVCFGCIVSPSCLPLDSVLSSSRYLVLDRYLSSGIHVLSSAMHYFVSVDCLALGICCLVVDVYP